MVRRDEPTTARLHIGPEGDKSLWPAALGYLDRGWSIIPVIGKKAAGLWKPFQTCPADETTLRRLCAKKGVTGLAVVLGRVSGGLAVRDFDEAGAYHAWAAENPNDAAFLPTVKTARGFHVYGRLDQETFVNLPDGELRADSLHYVVLPPSIHPDGPAYAWVNPLPDVGTPLLPLPPLPSSSSQRKKAQANASKTTACAHPPVILADEVAKAIARSLPTAWGQRNRRLFDLARQLKRIMPDVNADTLRDVLLEWHRQALPFIATKDFSESWTDFVLAWQKVKWPAGCSLRDAMAAADRDGLPTVAETYDGNLRRLAALCWQLQCRWGGQPFPLGCREAAELLEVSAIKAWRLLKTLQFDGVIRLVKKGRKASKKASEWRFTAAR